MFLFFPFFFCNWSLVFILLWSDKMLDIISMLLNLLGLVLCPSMWSIQESSPCAPGNNVDSAVWGWNVCVCVCVCVCVLLSCVQLFVTPWAVAHQASLSMEFSRQILEWVAIPFFRGSSQLGNWTWVSHIAGRFFTVRADREAHMQNKVVSNS